LRELAPTLAHHYSRAEAWAQACEYAERSAEAASGAYANREALERYDQAIAAALRGSLAASLQTRLYAARAKVHAVLGAFEPARGDLETALGLAEADGDVAARATLLGELGMLWGGHRDYQQGLALTREAVRLAESAANRRVLAQALVKTGLMELNLARVSESRRVLERALGVFGELGDQRGQAETLDVLSMAVGIEGSGRESGEYADRALAAFRELGDRTPEPSLITNRGFWMLYSGDWSGEALMRQGLAAATALGARSDQAYAHAALSDTAEMFGAFGVGLRECQTGLAIAREIGHLEWTALCLSAFGRLRRECGDPRTAVTVHEEMLDIVRTLGSVIWTADALGELGRDRLALGDDRGAAALLTDAVATAGSAVKFMLPPLNAQVELLLHQGEARRALDAARRCQALGRELRLHFIEARRLEAEALRALGELEAAEVAASDAKDQALAVGADKGSWRSRLTLADVLHASGRVEAAAGERAEALGTLRRVATDLPDDLRDAFEHSLPMRRARGEA
jgi:tetratricopeptide (TPR) repeat protein